MLLSWPCIIAFLGLVLLSFFWLHIVACLDPYCCFPGPVLSLSLVLYCCSASGSVMLHFLAPYRRSSSGSVLSLVWPRIVTFLAPYHRFPWARIIAFSGSYDYFFWPRIDTLLLAPCCRLPRPVSLLSLTPYLRSSSDLVLLLFWALYCCFLDFVLLLFLRFYIVAFLCLISSLFF